MNGEFIDAMAYMQINEFHLGTTSSSVPEPSSLLLVGMGLLGLESSSPKPAKNLTQRVRPNRPRRFAGAFYLNGEFWQLG